MAEPGDDAKAFIRDAPFEVVKELLGRLSPKGIFRMRAVCRAWRDKLRDGPLLRFLHRKEPPRPLLCFDRIACPDRYAQLRDYCVDSLDLRSDKLRSVVRFTDNEDIDFDEYDLKGLTAGWIDEFRVDYEKMEKYCQVDNPMGVVVHGSHDGHLLVCSVAGWYVINPVTRHWVALPSLSHLDVVGFYEHVPSDEYRVLCFCAKESPPVYCVFTVTTRRLRNIGLPVHQASPDLGLALGVETSYLSPPIHFIYKIIPRLHWSPHRRQGYRILVFDILTEEFSWMSPPAARGQAMRLLELPTGHLGMSISGAKDAALELWRLEDYEKEAWAPLYRIQLVLQQMPVLQEEGFWLPAVVSGEGDVLIETRHRLLHCDRNGNLLRQFWFPERRFAVRHMLRESLCPHPMFRARKIPGAAEPPFFLGLCSDDDPSPSSSWHLCFT